MKISKLDAPLRVYWDVNFKHSSDDILQKEDIFKIAGRILAGRPFFVNLGEDILNYEHLNELLEKFQDAKIKLSLSSSNIIKDKKDLGFLNEHKLDFLEFKLNPHIATIKRNKKHLDKINKTLKMYLNVTDKVCPSLVVTADNYKLLP